MAKVIVIGESHLDIIAELLCLEFKSSISNIALELPQMLNDSEMAISHLEQTRQQYKALIEQFKLNKEMLGNEELLYRVEFILWQFKQISIKLAMLQKLQIDFQSKKINFYAIDKNIDTKPMQEFEKNDLLKIMKDPERDIILADNLGKIAEKNEGTTIAIVGYEHLKPIMTHIQTNFPEQVANFTFVHCFSEIVELPSTAILIAAPSFTTSWQDENNIIHLDCRNMSAENIVKFITATKSQDLKQFRNDNTVTLIPINALNHLFSALTNHPYYSFSPEFYDNYLLEELYDSLSSQQDQVTVQDLENFIENIDYKHGPADPRLTNIYKIIGLQKLIAVKSLKNLSIDVERKELTNSLNILKTLIEEKIDIRIADKFTKAIEISNSILGHLIDYKKNQTDKETVIKEVDNLIKDYQNIFENLMTEYDKLAISELEKEQLEQVKTRIANMENFPKMLPAILDNISHISLFQLETFRKVLSPIESNFTDTKTKDDYYKAINFYSKAMLALLEDNNLETPTHKELFIIENLTKAGEFGFALADLELGNYYKNKKKFNKALEAYLAAAVKGCRAAYSNIVMLIMESNEQLPLDYYLVQACYIHFVRSQAVNNNYQLTFADGERLYSFIEKLKNSLENTVQQSNFRNIYKNAHQPFNLFKSLLPSQTVDFSLHYDVSEQLNYFTAGLNLILGNECEELYTSQDFQSTLTVLASLAKFYYDVMNKFQTPQEQLRALTLGIEKILSDESELILPSSIRFSLTTMLKEINKIAMTERMHLALNDINTMSQSDALPALETQQQQSSYNL